MGIGAWLADKIDIPANKVELIIIFNGAIGLYLINPGVTGLLYLNEYLFHIFRNQDTNYIFITFGIGIVLTVIIGIFSGTELPLFSRLLEEKKINDQSLITKVLTVDYLGTCMGLLLFTFYLFPIHGLVKSIVYSQSVAVCLIVPILLSFKRYSKALIALYTALFLICTVSSFSYDLFLNSINELSF